MNRINKQINELCEVSHLLVSKTYTKEFKNKYPLIKDLTPFEMSIIIQVYKKENIIIKDILESLKIPKSTLTSVINRLEKQNILKRKVNPKDKRSYILVLTNKGESIVKEHNEFENEEFKRIIESLDTYEERQILIDLLNKISNNL